VSARLRALLALIWWAGFYLLGLIVVGALFWVPWAEGTYSRQVTFAGVIAGVLGVTVAWALRPRFNPAPARQGRSLDRARAPALFAFVDDLARRAGTRPPAELYLTLEATAWTALERRSFFRRVPTLTLGLPLLTWMKQDELASVVAHEFGHHVGHDVALGPWVYRTRLALAGAIGQLDDSVFFLDVPFRAYGKLFLRLTASVSRAQELAADALAAKIAGATASRTALSLVHERGPLWQTYLHLDVLPFLQRGLRVPVLEGYRSLPETAGLRRRTRKRAPGTRTPRSSSASPPCRRPKRPGRPARPRCCCSETWSGTRRRWCSRPPSPAR
jgi:Zn-dependent protease with chaperone function